LLTVRDRNCQALAYVYFEEEPGRRPAAKLLTKDEARRHCCQRGKITGAIAETLNAQARPAGQSRKLPKKIKLVR